MNNDKFDYNIKCVSLTDYELELDFYVQNALMQLVFNKAVNNKTIKEKIKNNNNNIEINSFAVPQNYYKVLRTACNTPLKRVKQIFKKDGIELLTEVVTKATYIKISNIWHVKIYFCGMYADKR